MRRMAFTHTTAEVLARVKTVTRRTGWRTLKPGDLVLAVKQARGLKKGERVEPLATIRIIDVRVEPLSRLLNEPLYAEDEIPREGFPCWSAREFVDMFQRANRLRDADVPVTRIEFEYVDS
jgi:hypothetical protein